MEINDRMPAYKQIKPEQGGSCKPFYLAGPRAEGAKPFRVSANHAHI